LSRSSCEASQEAISTLIPANSFSIANALFPISFSTHHNSSHTLDNSPCSFTMLFVLSFIASSNAFTYATHFSFIFFFISSAASFVLFVKSQNVSHNLSSSHFTLATSFNLFLNSSLQLIVLSSSHFNLSYFSASVSIAFHFS